MSLFAVQDNSELLRLFTAVVTITNNVLSGPEIVVRWFERVIHVVLLLCLP